MAASSPIAPPVEKKRGLGCFGCGCLIIVLLILLLAGGIGAAGYYGYTQLFALTSPKPATIPTFDGGDDAYNRAKEKLNEFNHNLQNHLATTVHFTADELNTLIARSPDIDHDQVHIFVSITGDRARLQASLPTDHWYKDWLDGRYVHLDSTFGLKFDPSTHLLLFLPKNLQAGERVIYDSDAAASQGGSAQSVMQMYIASFNQMLTARIRTSAEGDQLISQAESIEIKNSELVIETK